jgi:(S)-sulfolactate dehydrogenase
MSVQAHDPYLPADDPAWAGIANVSRSDLLDTSDAVSLHVPLTPETAGSINAETLSAMRPGALLINTARGGIVDEDALVAALSNGDLGGAAIDVFSEEPIANPARFANVPNLILTPHIAGLTIESQQRVGAVVAEAVRATLSGG